MSDMINLEKKESRWDNPSTLTVTPGSWSSYYSGPPYKLYVLESGVWSRRLSQT